jgi:hypothetical protein
MAVLAASYASSVASLLANISKADVSALQACMSSDKRVRAPACIW